VQTWDLFRHLLPLRHPNVNSNEQLRRLGQVANKPTRANTLQHFLVTNSVARERRAVLQWLQSNACSGPDIDELTRDLQQNADRGDIIAHGWLHTRSSIKLKKSVTGWPHLLDRQSANISKSHVSTSGAPLVTQLDPDVTTRQGRKLQPQDEYFERAIWVGCFEHLRRGSSRQVIRDWCQERTEMWRAVSMSGIMLPAGNDENAGSKDDIAEEIDPSALALWRRMCYSLARQGGTDEYERAVYGILSGDITSVEKVAQTWDDFMFAHYNGLLRTQLDTFVLGLCAPGTASSIVQNFPAFDAVQFHGDAQGMEKRLIRSLESQESIRFEAMEPHKVLQASFISGDIEEYLYKQGLNLGTSGDFLGAIKSPVLGIDPDLQAHKYFGPKDYDGLRLVAHVYVLVTLLAELDTHERGGPDLLSGSTKHLSWRASQENILAKYTAFLRAAKLSELIPLYCTVLQSPRREQVLSASMIKETDPKRFVTQLQLMKRAGIDILRFVRAQVELMYQNISPAAANTFEAKTSFRILEVVPSVPRMGRTINAEFFGEDEDVIEKDHEYLIRSLEWLYAADQTWPDLLFSGSRTYKFFLSMR
jgi:nuclear pore complex protein Nup107